MPPSRSRTGARAGTRVSVRVCTRVVALVALACLTTACTGGDAGSELDGAPASAQGDLTAIRADLAAIFAGDHPEDRQRDDGECFARSFTGTTSAELMAEGGLLDDDGRVRDPLPPLSPGLAEAWVDAQFECTDFVEESTGAALKLSRGDLDEAAYAACLTGLLTTQQMRDAVAAGLEARWDAPELDRLSKAQATCREQTRG